MILSYIVSTQAVMVIVMQDHAGNNRQQESDCCRFLTRISIAAGITANGPTFSLFSETGLKNRQGADMANKTDAEQLPVQINTTDEVSRGRYSNLLLVSHGPDEFILDWLLNSPNGPHLLSRIIISPGNAKRVIEALKANVEKYEQMFGAINLVELPEQNIH